jgi:methyl-accepting chemotaxis protein
MEFACGIPEGMVMKVAHATEQDEIDSPRKAGIESLERLEGEPAGAFVFDCICHANILQEDFDKSVNAVADAIDVPMVGCETYGEVCMREGELSGYHNTTTSILMLPD